MGILALKIASIKNGVSKLHGAVSRELFSDVWSNIAPAESPITYVTNGIHTCSWTALHMKELYNEYLEPYWQDNIHEQKIWEGVNQIPNEKVWKAHMSGKHKLMDLIKENIRTQFSKNNVDYDTIKEVTSRLNPNALTIGFARRFATYKRATLIFRDLEKATKLFNDPDRPLQIIFAGKAHPKDVEGQDLIKYLHEISLMPQFKGKVFLLENYNITLARYLVSGVDVWLNNPRRPMEASGTSGEKAAINGVPNFSILDGWWAEGYNGKNGWAIGTNAEYDSYEVQDVADSESIYSILEEQIIPMYYNQNELGFSDEWVETMKESIRSTGARYSTARMLVDYTEKIYMPIINLNNNYFKDLNTVVQYCDWKNQLYSDWENILITQDSNAKNLSMDAGNHINVKCEVKLNDIQKENIEAQVYYGRIGENGIIECVNIIPMYIVNYDDNDKKVTYEAKIELNTGGHYGYTFRVMPKHAMILEPANLNLIKWIVE